MILDKLKFNYFKIASFVINYKIKMQLFFESYII